MKKVLSTFFRDSGLLWNLPKTLWFNLHYLPFKQAIKLPIWLRKAHLVKCGGKIIIESDHIKTGMIRLGGYGVSIYPDSGIIFENRGMIIFKGRCGIGNSSGISIAGGTLKIGSEVTMSAGIKLVCYDKVTIGDNVMIGWNSMVCDCDMHYVIDRQTGDEYPRTGEIVIGAHSWLCNNVYITKKAVIPPNTIVAAHSLVNKTLNVPEYSLVAGVPARLKKGGVEWRH